MEEKEFVKRFVECLFPRIFGGTLFPRWERKELFPRINCIWKLIAELKEEKEKEECA